MRTLTKQQKALARVKAAQQMGLQPSAREMFPHLRGLLIASRPVIEPEHVVTYDHEFSLGNGRRGTWTQRKTVPAKYGPPTFRNVIDSEGRHV